MTRQITCKDIANAFQRLIDKDPVGYLINSRHKTWTFKDAREYCLSNESNPLVAARVLSSLPSATFYSSVFGIFSGQHFIEQIFASETKTEAQAKHEYHNCNNHISSHPLQSATKNLEWWFYCLVCDRDVKPVHEK